MPISPEVAHLRARRANAVQRGDEPTALAAKQALAAAQLEAYIDRVVASAPPLTSEQKDRIAAILHGGRLPQGGDAA